MKLFCFGLGYSAQRLHQLHASSFQMFSGCVRTPEKAAHLRNSGIEAFSYAGGEAGHDMREALGNADILLVSAAPDEKGDPMLRQFAGLLHKTTNLRQVIYWSTVGVYGDHGGTWINETAPLNATSERGKRRILAERSWQDFGQAKDIPVQLHRLAGIYGPGRSAVEDVREGTARRIIKEGQVFNRIHVDDIAGAALAGMMHRAAEGAFNICDNEPCPPQDVIEFAASLLGQSLPQAILFSDAKLSQMARSFYAESKRCANLRLRNELNYALLYPTYRQGLAAIAKK